MPSIQFKGKSFVQNHHLAVPFHQLVPQKGKSLTDRLSLSDNLIIHGDNLTALKALLPTYASKIKCIYIDPPYNTGNEGWVYNDNVKSPIIKEWIGEVVGKEGEDLTRHDKWLCMMLPRIKLLRELLTDDGVVFISIDDNEQHNLRQIMDEVFGQSNFLANVIWEKGDSPRMDAEYFSGRHDSVVVYAKNLESVELKKNKFDDDNLPAHYDKQDENGRTYYLKPLRAMGGQGESRQARPNLYYALTAPDGTEVFPILKSGTDGAWRWGKDKIEKENDRIEWKKGSTGWTPYFRIYADTSAGKPPETIFYHKEVGSSRTAKAQLREVFEDGIDFDTPKPVGLIKKIIKLVCNDGDIVLDSFAGSGTTGQAVLELNSEDGTNLNFILVECEEYADTTTAERIRRVIKGLPNSNNPQLKVGLGGTFSFFELGNPIETSSLLSGSKLPSYEELGRYVYYTATGEDFDDSKLDESKNYIGTSSQFSAYMYYRPDIEYLKTTALTLDEARKLRSENGDKPLLVFAPTKYVEQTELDNLKITFCQLPFEIYKVK
jgi:adenine-specific DNA-methyltransferase